MKKIITALFALTLAGCLATTPIAIDKTSKPRASIYKTYIAAKQAPTVIVSHGSSGVDNPPLRLAGKIHDWGYNAVVVDHYSEKGISTGTHNVGNVIAGATGSERALDVIATARWVQSQPWHKGKIVLIGYSQGGATVNALANKAKIMDRKFPRLVNEQDYEIFAGAIGMYPSCGYKLDASPPEDSAPFPVQLHLGTDDDLARPEWCATQAKNYELLYYKGATHLFDSSVVGAKFTQRYNAEADKLSIERIHFFLDKHLR